MLNCTDAGCSSHHAHYYQHVLLQHHLQDHRGQHHAMSGEPNDVSDSSNLNNTDTETSSHVDAPNDSLYMLYGVLIAMGLVALIIILLAVTISKLRKRSDDPARECPNNQETTGDTTPPTEPAAVVVQQTKEAAAAETHAAAAALSAAIKGDPLYSSTPMFLWQYPPRHSNDQETLVQNLPTERPGLCRGFRKNLRGKWRRLLHRKPTQEVYTIPAELRDQLKQIYVY